MSEKKATCDTCIYQEFSECKRMPPVPYVYYKPRDGTDDPEEISGHRYPSVSYSDWCGEWKPVTFKLGRES